MVWGAVTVALDRGPAGCRSATAVGVNTRHGRYTASSKAACSTMSRRCVTRTWRGTVTG